MPQIVLAQMLNVKTQRFYITTYQKQWCATQGVDGLLKSENHFTEFTNFRGKLHNCHTNLCNLMVPVNWPKISSGTVLDFQRVYTTNGPFPWWWNNEILLCMDHIYCQRLIPIIRYCMAFNLISLIGIYAHIKMLFRSSYLKFILVFQLFSLIGEQVPRSESVSCIIYAEITDQSCLQNSFFTNLYNILNHILW